MKRTNLIKATLAAGLAGAVLSSGSAMAQQAPAFDFAVETVSLETTRDVARVHARLSDEAASYCGSLIEQGYETAGALSLCQSDVVEAVVQRIGDAQLSRYHQQVEAQSARPYATALN